MSVTVNCKEGRVVAEFEQLLLQLIDKKNTWLITGVAGFIGSNLLEALLKLDQRVVGLDNFSSGHQRNLEEVKVSVTPDQWANFQFFEGDICSLDACRRVMSFSNVAGTQHPVEYVLHQAALGSVPRSIEDPILANAYNVDGFLNMLVAARDAGVRRFVYAASSATYGDHPGRFKVEDEIGRLLSPYAVTKYVNELYADVFARTYGLESIGLRYFNVFGKRQDPEGAYAAVIPKWIDALTRNESVYINGDGGTSRDFCYIENVVQANLLAAMTDNPVAVNQIYNVAVGESTSLNQLYETLREILINQYPLLANVRPIYRDFRAGDIRHSLADISKANNLLGYLPKYGVEQGLKETMNWYTKAHSN